MGKLPYTLRQQRTPKRVLELIVRHDVHHKPPQFGLENLLMTLDNLDEGRKVVYFLVVREGREYFGEAWFKRGD